MNLSKMREAFLSATSGLASDLTDAEIEEHLNRFYRWVIPADVDGAVSEIVWLGTCNTVYVFQSVPEYVIAVTRPTAWIYDVGSSTPIRLSVYADFERFTEEFPDATSKTGRPTAMCMYGGVLYFDRVPDQAYTYSIPCRGGPSAALAADGIGNENHAQTVIHGAAWHYLLEKEDEAGAAREGARYQAFKSLLSTQSKSGFSARRPARSF